MRLFHPDVERKLHERDLARSWARSGLLGAEQLKAVEEGLGPLPTQGGWAVRVLFFGFAWLFQSALLGWFGIFLFLGRSKGTAVFYLAFALAFGWAAEHLIRSRRLYRFGVEESLAVGAAGLACAGLYVLLQESAGGHPALLAGLLALGAGLWLRSRYGYAYGAFAAIGALGVVVFNLGLGETGSRAALALSFWGLAIACRQKKDAAAHERQELELFQAVLFLGAYLILNLRLDSLAPWSGLQGNPERDAFYWASYAAIWLLPAAGLAWAIAARLRPLLDAAILCGLLTLAVNKPYLGLARRDWDPAVLGLALLAAASALSRWLKAGPEGARAGFTGRELLVPKEGLGLSGALAAVVAAGAAAPAPGHGASTPSPAEGFKGEGGRSGGAGASGGF